MGTLLKWAHGPFHQYDGVPWSIRVGFCRDRLDAGGFRPVEDTILFLTWHEVQDTELLDHIKIITKYDIIRYSTFITTITKTPHSFPLKIRATCTTKHTI